MLKPSHLSFPQYLDFESQLNKTRVPTHFTKLLSSSSKPDRSATRDMVVLSPPGIISASHFSSSVGVRISVKIHSVGVEECEGNWRSAA